MKDKIKKIFNSETLKFAKDRVINITTKTIKTYSKYNTKFGEYISNLNISANLISIIGFIIGLSAINFIAMESYATALFVILINRFFDGLDGAVARAEKKASDFGAFLDVTLDYIFYAGIIFGFAWARPEDNAVPAAFLLFALISSSTVNLAYTLVKYKKHIEKEDNIEIAESPFYFLGFAQGYETIIALILFCLMPTLFLPIALIFGFLSLIKTLSKITSSYYDLALLEDEIDEIKRNKERKKEQ